MRHFFPLSLLAFAVVACDGGAGPTDMIPEELTGTWEATPSCLPECGFTLARVGEPADSVNFVSALQQTFVLNLTESGRFSLTSIGGATTIRARAEAEGAMLIIRDETGTRDTADYVLEGDYLSLSFRDVTEQFDFDSDGSGDAAMVRARLQRR